MNTEYSGYQTLTYIIQIQRSTLFLPTWVSHSNFSRSLAERLAAPVVPVATVGKRLMWKLKPHTTRWTTMERSHIQQSAKPGLLTWIKHKPWQPIMVHTSGPGKTLLNGSSTVHNIKMYRSHAIITLQRKYLRKFHFQEASSCPPTSPLHFRSPVSLRLRSHSSWDSWKNCIDPVFSLLDFSGKPKPAADFCA